MIPFYERLIYKKSGLRKWLPKIFLWKRYIKKIRTQENIHVTRNWAKDTMNLCCFYNCIQCPELSKNKKFNLKKKESLDFS